jgi:TRAP-T family transporter, periplasmic ligand binding protein, dctQ
LATVPAASPVTGNAMAQAQKQPRSKRRWSWLDHVEEFICAFLLVGFVSLMFAQIVSRQLFHYTILWADELATHMFVWFAYFGAVVAARLSAHNRVTFQFTFFPPIVKKVSEGLADLIWVAFNLYFAWLSIDFIFFRMNRFWSSQTLGLPMKYFYLVLPVAFVLMSVRILANDYRVLIKGEALKDPEQAEIERLAHQHHEE